ncbi:unnamed protein product [Brassicogethes aeneus]|uniref:Uncharacterized protein n=1 Tax=Brassicogethes aeneus TaxID=1431903 RepID=A0A9P0B9E9_BRAAE|nr:unnamed protein product [Brassicogethes aeneus]
MYKIVFILAVFLQFCNSAKIEGNAVENEVLDKLENLRRKLQDHYIIKNERFDFPENDYINGFLNINLVNISGLKSFEISTLNFDSKTYKLHLDITFQNLDFAFDYTTNITFGIDTEVHNDDVSIRNHFSGLAFQTKSRFHEIFKHPKVFFLQFQLSLEDIVFQLEGLLNDDELSKGITDSVNKYFVKFIRDQKTFIKVLGSPFAEHVLNKILMEQ